MPIPLYDRLDGQVALVTGANRGIGAAIAAKLVDLGATVYCSHRRADWAPPDGMRAVRFDILNTDAVAEGVATVVADAGRLDILVNNAGVLGKDEKPHEMDIAWFDAVWRTNVRGTYSVCQAAIPHLTEREGGRIVNVSSGAGSFGEGMMGSHFAYCVSKSGLNSLTYQLDESYRFDGLIVNAVCPGWVRTDMGGPDAERSVEEGAETPAWLARFRPGAPSGRFWRDKAEIAW